MLDKIVVEEKNGIKQIAGLKNGDLREFVIQEANKANEGNIYLGKITKKIQTVNGKEGYFVNIGGGRDAFINAEEKELETLKAHEGQDIIVQVIQEQRAEKGARLSRFLQIAGVNLVYCPYGCEIEVSSKIVDDEKQDELVRLVSDHAQDGGWIVRTHAAETKSTEIIAELEKLQKQFMALLTQAKTLKAPASLLIKDNLVQEMIARNKSSLDCVEVNNHLLEKELEQTGISVEYNNAPFAAYGIDDMVATALQKSIKLNCGGRVIIEETKALVAIDVDSGEGAAQGSLNRLNQEAAVEIAKQIVLRNLSGKIIIDFAGMTEFKFLKNTIEILEKELQDDFAKARVLGLSRAGNVEIIRMRRRPSLNDVLTEECSTCCGTGRVEK